MNLILIILSIHLITIFGNNDEYFGTFLGSLKNESYGLTGDVYIANSSTIQIINFSINSKFIGYFFINLIKKKNYLFKIIENEISFVISNSTTILHKKNVYEIIMNDNFYDKFLAPVYNFK